MIYKILLLISYDAMISLRRTSALLYHSSILLTSENHSCILIHTVLLNRIFNFHPLVCLTSGLIASHSSFSPCVLMAGALSINVGILCKQDWAVQERGWIAMEERITQFQPINFKYKLLKYEIPPKYL